ncbi:acetyl-CoA carboxylase biotin carboxyl carrier protein subunit [Saccharicrinis fermentans]|uniref:Glutaconyl-CoA decarboxylase subunit gamma n=1 Tax=Saccharicrinis fermentans DSM 9555 = JCM 21142 TaxID=869213 RepID=W7Y0H8_9BACT|nr:acetyl-CoA carboxylase biotin carboxyl carrier protein subunit [Saccharicrinis fermentans]GAF01452.1 glutaconyl-CoA decarboxylase subunit gamma [Saccharicrinis fermentans DSM 9555 = JCM 21142]
MKLIHHTKNYTLSGDKKVNIQVRDNKLHKINNRRTTIDIEDIENDEFLIKINGKSHVGEVLDLKQNEVSVVINGNTYHFTVDTELASKRKEKLAKNSGKKIAKINAPLPGEIVAVLMSEGQEVHKGEPVLILEAMKMQNEIVSPVNGIIKSIQVKAEDTVMKDQMLFDVDPEK